MRAPGFVTDLGPKGQQGWDAYIAGLLTGPEGALALATADNGGVAPSVLLDGDPALLPGQVQVDWGGYPVRVKQALDQPDIRLDKFIDWTRASLTFGRSY